MPLFQKKPVVIEARRFSGDCDLVDLTAWCGGVYEAGPTISTLMIPTLEGVMRADLGDWIIKGVKGEFYPCKPDIFEATYQAAASGGHDPLTFAEFAAANAARNQEWNPHDQLTLTFRVLELVGEAGELANVAKKLEREALGLRGSRATTDDLKDELGDVVICAFLVALQANIDLGAAVRRKFNASSDKMGLSVKLPEAK